MTYGMLIDLKKCVGCHACSVACKEAHGTRPGVRRSRVDRVFEGIVPRRAQDGLSHAVHALRDAPPAWRSARRTPPTSARTASSSSIRTSASAAAACQTVCPYDARHLAASEDGYFGSELNEYEAVMYETMPPSDHGQVHLLRRAHRRRQGREVQACVAACPAGARRVRRPRGHQGPGRGCRRLPAQGRGGHEPVCVVPAPQGERVTFPPGRLPSTAGGPPPRRPRNSSSAGGVPPFAAALCGPPLCVSARGNAVRLATV